jgi:hypothetical protein
VDTFRTYSDYCDIHVQDVQDYYRRISEPECTWTINSMSMLKRWAQAMELGLVLKSTLTGSKKYLTQYEDTVMAQPSTLIILLLLYLPSLFISLPYQYHGPIINDL